MNLNTRVGSVESAGLVLSVAIFTLCSYATVASAGSAQQITNFGNNPSGIGMYLYTPTNVVANPPILVVPHACHGKGTDVCQSGNAFAQQADKYGFLLICPSAVSGDGCWDVHSTADLTHDGGGDASGIISMVNYVVQNKNGDADRVYVAGHSSGGMMTNIMLGSYPDVFKAGAAYAGVPFACYAQGAVDSLGWNSSCATGKVTKTGAQWGDLVRAAYPDFNGTRPRIQLWHGTVDDTVNIQNFREEIKQWTNVLGVSETPTSTESNAIQSTWIRTRYTDGSGVIQVEAIEETGQPHNLDVNAAEAIRFFGLDGSSSVPDAGAKDSGTDPRGGTGGSGSGTGDGTGGAGLGGSGGSGGRSGGSGGGGGANTATGGTGGSGGSSSGGSGTGGRTGGGGGNAAGGSAGGTTVVIGTGGASTGGSGGQSTTAGTGGAIAGSSDAGLGGSSAAGTGGKVGSQGSSAVAGSGGSTGQGMDQAGGNPAGCSCSTGAHHRLPTGGYWPVWLLLALGLCWRSSSQAIPCPGRRTRWGCVERPRTGKSACNLETSPVNATWLEPVAPLLPLRQLDPRLAGDVSQDPRKVLVTVLQWDVVP